MFYNYQISMFRSHNCIFLAEKKELKRQEKILSHDRKTALYKAETKEYRARVSHRRARSRAMSKTGVGHLFGNIKRDTRRGKHGLRIF